jgi:hypothetical protein
MLIGLCFAGINVISYIYNWSVRAENKILHDVCGKSFCELWIIEANIVAYLKKLAHDSVTNVTGNVLVKMELGSQYGIRSHIRHYNQRALWPTQLLPETVFSKVKRIEHEVEHSS